MRIQICNLRSTRNTKLSAMCSSNVHAIYSYILKTLHTSTSFVQFTKIINDQKIRNSIYYDLLFVNQSPNTEAQTLSIIDQRSLNRLLGTTIYGWRWSKKRCHRCWCKDQDREFTASSSSDERQGVRGTLDERSKERETIRYQVGCEARTRGGRARKKRLGRRGNDLCHSLVATPAPAADQRPALALNSGQAVDTGRALVLAAETATRERERGREQRAPATEKKFVLGSPKETTVITQGPAIEVNPFLRRTRAEDSARTIHRVHVFADRVCFASNQMSRNRGNGKEIVRWRLSKEDAS